jgi:hypothetical protein
MLTTSEMRLNTLGKSFPPPAPAATDIKLLYTFSCTTLLHPVVQLDTTLLHPVVQLDSSSSSSSSSSEEGEPLLPLLSNHYCEHITTKNSSSSATPLFSNLRAAGLVGLYVC